MKVIIFEGKKYHCLSCDVEPWSEPIIVSCVPGLQVCFPHINFTPCRWYFKCQEGVIAAIPLGYFDIIKPDAVPVEIRGKPNWPWPKKRRIADKEKYISKGDATGERFAFHPVKDKNGKSIKVEAVSEDEYSNVFDAVVRNLTAKLRENVIVRVDQEAPDLSDDGKSLMMALPIEIPEAEIHNLIEQMKFEAIYDNGNKDYFISVVVFEPTREEAKRLERDDVQTNREYPTASATNSKPLKARGRPPATPEEKKRDASITKRWRESGERKVSDFARREGLRPKEVHRAINSHAHRESRRKLIVK